MPHPRSETGRLHYNELERENKRLRGVLAKIANLPTDQLASPEQCVAVVLAMDALSELPND